MDYRNGDSDTLIFVGGDHETGGMGLGIGVDYFVDTDVIRNAKKTYEWAGNTFQKRKGDPVAIMSQATGITDFTPEEIKAIKMAAEKVMAKKRSPNKYNRNSLSFTYADIMSKRAHIGWTTWAHTANPVMATAIGPGSEELGGYYDNVIPAMILARAWGIYLKSWDVD
jgi:alkaline phosphatase